MKIRALELEQFRKFDRPVRISGFSDALNVLCGPNEFGKSTILAAVRGLLFERYSSKAEPVRRMQPSRGNAAPRLAMEFDLGDGRWRIEKRFLHQPWARLTGPDSRVFEADSAEEELQRLLGFGAAGKKGATAEQLGVWGALWVTQRESVEQADLSSDLARSTVVSCLDAEVGILTGSEKGQAIMRAAREQLASLHDGNGRPRGRYKEVLAAIAESERSLGDLRERAMRLSEDSDALRLATTRLAKLNDQFVAQQEQDGLADARRRKVDAQLFEQTRAATQAQLDLARQECKAAAQELSARTARRSAISEAEGGKRAADQTVADLRARADDKDRALTACRQAEVTAQTQLANADNAVRNSRAILDLVRRAASLTSLRLSLAQADAAQDEIAGLVAGLDVVRIDKERITAIRQALRYRDAAESALQAQATVIDFDLEEAAAGKVALDGTGLALGRRTVSVVMPTEISIAEFGRIVVRPAIRDIEKLKSAAVQTAAQLGELLLGCGCRDADEAEEKWVERGEREAVLRDARAKLERLTPGDAPSGLEPGVEALRERVKVLELRVEAGRAELGLADLPNVNDAAHALRQAEDADLAAREQLTQARAELDIAVAASSTDRAALVTAESAEQRAQQELDRLRREDAEAVARESDDTLANRLVEADGRQAGFSQALATLDRDRSPDTVEAMEARIQRYEKALKNRDEAVRKLREEIAGLRARITQEGGAGLDEAIAAAERGQDALAQERDAHVRDAQVLTLVLATLEAAERETKERYLEPVVRRVTPYLRGLFPGAEIRCDDALRITGLLRDGSGLQDFDRLSDGTQEQLAVLARLAFAELLIDQGKPAMVILDDALAYSDDERIERMFDILSQAAARTQILVLTCREDLFARLGPEPA